MKNREENENRTKKSSPAKQKPVALTPEVRAVGFIILACLGVICIAITIRVFRWVSGL